jgi:hypothetical protein
MGLNLFGLKFTTFPQEGDVSNDKIISVTSKMNGTFWFHATKTFPGQLFHVDTLTSKLTKQRNSFNICLTVHH